MAITFRFISSTIGTSCRYLNKKNQKFKALSVSLIIVKKSRDLLSQLNLLVKFYRFGQSLTRYSFHDRTYQC